MPPAMQAVDRPPGLCFGAATARRGAVPAGRNAGPSFDPPHEVGDTFGSRPSGKEAPRSPDPGLEILVLGHLRGSGAGVLAKRDMPPMKLGED